MNAIISIKDLQKTYYSDGAETPVLHGLTLDIHKGEFVAIMGPSGSGKSTLLQILGLLDRATGGSYIFEGRDSREYTENELASIRNEKMGFIFQAFNLLPKTTVFDNVKLPLLYSKIPIAQWDALAKEAIEAVGLTHRLEYQTSQLSGGEKQRVAIARALVTSPAVIFADEPTGNLDSKSGSMVMQVIQRLHEDLGHTIILITHETSTAEHAERIVRIHDGNIESDTKMDTRRRAADSFIK